MSLKLETDVALYDCDCSMYVYHFVMIQLDNYET